MVFFYYQLSFTILDLRKIRRHVKLNSHNHWIFHYSHMLEICLIIFLVEGNFLNRQDSELLYYLISAGLVIINLAYREINNKQEVQYATKAN